VRASSRPYAQSRIAVGSGLPSAVRTQVRNSPNVNGVQSVQINRAATGGGGDDGAPVQIEGIRAGAPSRFALCIDGPGIPRAGRAAAPESRRAAALPSPACHGGRARHAQTMSSSIVHRPSLSRSPSCRTSSDLDHIPRFSVVCHTTRRRHGASIVRQPIVPPIVRGIVVNATQSRSHH
jgi:hypothetical protein